jgi:hypothetical protein
MAGVELVTSGDAGRILGVSRQRVHQLRDTYRDFPDPVGQVGGRDVWRRTDIERWARRHGRATGDSE